MQTLVSPPSRSWCSAVSGRRVISIGTDTALVRDLSSAHSDAHGTPPLAYMLGSTSDARVYLEDFDVPAVCYGASGRNLHGVDEYVELQSIIDAARTLARFLLKRFSRERSGQ